jgi:hypothetical protein
MSYTAPFTVDQVAAMLHCEDKTVRARARELGGLKVGRDWVFPCGAFFARLDALALQGSTLTEPSAPAAVAVQAAPSSTRRKPPPALPALRAVDLLDRDR